MCVRIRMLPSVNFPSQLALGGKGGYPKKRISGVGGKPMLFKDLSSALVLACQRKRIFVLFSPHVDFLLGIYKIVVYISRKASRNKET